MSELSEIIQKHIHQEFKSNDVFIPDNFEKSCDCKFSIPSYSFSEFKEYDRSKQDIVKGKYKGIHRYFCPRCGKELTRKKNTK